MKRDAERNSLLAIPWMVFGVLGLDIYWVSCIFQRGSFPFDGSTGEFLFPWPQHWGPKPELPEGLSKNAILDALEE